LFGAVTAPLTLKVISFNKEKLDRNSLIFFAIMGPVPALYLIVGITAHIFGLVVALAFMGIFWSVEKIGSIFFK
jgi:membrane associated rhomboid family serine protease